MHLPRSVTVAILLVPSLGYARSIYARDIDDAQLYGRDPEPDSDIFDHDLHQRWAEAEVTIPESMHKIRSDELVARDAIAPVGGPKPVEAVKPAAEQVPVPPVKPAGAEARPGQEKALAAGEREKKAGLAKPPREPTERQKFRQEAAIFGDEDRKFRQQTARVRAGDQKYRHERLTFEKDQSRFRQEEAKRLEAGKLSRKPEEPLRNPKDALRKPEDALRKPNGAARLPAAHAPIAPIGPMGKPLGLPNAATPGANNMPAGAAMPRVGRQVGIDRRGAEIWGLEAADLWGSW
ncbi:hypothetical protein MMC26_006858 [Xylographa opegraphella]|nr:hypothetical protein [Xylographa opegraphella]